MPKLTGEELSKLYPAAKTYDELQAQREERREIRRPKFVSARIALWTSLCVPVVAATCYAALRMVVATNTSSSMAVLTGVCTVILLAMIGLAILFYLRSLIDDIASKTIFATPMLYALLLGILCIAGGIGVLLYSRQYSLVTITLVVMFWVFVASFLATSWTNKQSGR